MQNSQINRVIKLVRRTGDKAVIMDNESDSVMMLMDLDAYEKILENSGRVETLTEEELMDRINRDVAVWRAYNDKERSEKLVDEEVVEQKPMAKSAPIMEEKRPILAKNNSFVPVEDADLGRTPILPEESASDIVAEEEEEKFYLEPVEQALYPQVIPYFFKARGLAKFLDICYSGYVAKNLATFYINFSFFKKFLKACLQDKYGWTKIYSDHSVIVPCKDQSYG